MQTKHLTQLPFVVRIMKTRHIAELGRLDYLKEKSFFYKTGDLPHLDYVPDSEEDLEDDSFFIE